MPNRGSDQINIRICIFRELSSRVDLHQDPITTEFFSCTALLIGANSYLELSIRKAAELMHILHHQAVVDTIKKNGSPLTSSLVICGGTYFGSGTLLIIQECFLQDCHHLLTALVICSKLTAPDGLSTRFGFPLMDSDIFISMHGSHISHINSQ